MLENISSAINNKLFLCLAMLLAVTCPNFAAEYDIRQFGAVGDGKTLNTFAIQKAIDEAYQKGGGQVVIPNGNFVTGSIVLKSGVGLFFHKKAKLTGSIRASDYIRLNRWKALIMADNAHDIYITGNGTIDGRGAELGLYIDSLFYAGAIDSVNYHLNEKRAWAELRPQIIEFNQCSRIIVRGVTIKNSSCWVQTYEKCCNLVIEHVRVDSDAYWNNDGIDIVDCSNVVIRHCRINSSDDGICIKSEDFGLTHINDSIYISDCTIRSSASAVKFGTSLVSGARNVIIRNIKIYDTYRSAIAIECTQGGFIENILVENIKAKNTGNAIFIRIGKVRGAPKAGPLRNVTIRNVSVSIPFTSPDINYKIRGPGFSSFHNICPSSITGNPGINVENVLIENVTIKYPGRGVKAYANMPLYRIKDVPELETAYPEFTMFGELPAWGLYVRHTDGLTLKNIQLRIAKEDYRPAMVFDDVKNIHLDRIKIIGDNKQDPFFFNNSENTTISNTRIIMK